MRTLLRRIKRLEITTKREEKENKPLENKPLENKPRLH